MMTIFTAITKIADVIYSKSKFDFAKTEKIKAALEEVQKYFGVDEEEALILSYFIYRKVEEDVNYFTVDDISRDVNISVTESLSYIPVIDGLIKKHCFCLRDKVEIPEDFKLGQYDCFDVDDELIDLISYNTPFSEYRPKFSNHRYTAKDLIAKLNSLSIRVLKGPYSLKHYLLPYMKDKWVYQMMKDLGAIDDSNESNMWWDQDYDNVKVFLLFARSLWTEKSVTIKGALEEANYSISDIINVLNDFKLGNTPVLKKGYLEIDKTDIADNMKVEWGPKVKEAFKGYEELLLQDQSAKELQKIIYKDIKEKTLFYNESNQKDIDRLESIIKEENYINLRKRLKEKGLPMGLTVLLYGAPGTGKTETVMQLAKKTKRDVYHLNIEQIKSCWVGESEKNVKSIFKAYYSSKSKLKPILLFNEADAIVSKRTAVDGANSAVVKMENAIQNILLEELEKFDGIFIATSNLVINLDSAFERRFLYKLEFQNPTLEVKRRIWKNKIPELDEETVDEVSRNFDFSGGQIENISKKIDIDYILYGNRPKKDTVIDFCKKEKFDNSESRLMGFHM